jgi:hypothetical protein
MHLPSFLWLWKIAAWSMGLSLLAYTLLAITGFWMFQTRTTGQSPVISWIDNTPVQVIHYIIGMTMISLVMLLLAIGIVGTLGHFGTLGHSSHLWAGLIVVLLVLLSGMSAKQIQAGKPWARRLHIGLNVFLLIGFTMVSLTGWSVVQKYLP